MNDSGGVGSGGGSNQSAAYTNPLGSTQTAGGTGAAAGGGGLGMPTDDNSDRFFLVANRDAGKGFVGNYVFQVDGHRLAELGQAIDELMLRRFPAFTAAPGTRVLPTREEGQAAVPAAVAVAAEEEREEGGGQKFGRVPESAAIDIQVHRAGGVKTASFGVTSSSLSPPGGGRSGLFGLNSSVSPQNAAAGAVFAASSSLPGPGMTSVNHRPQQQRCSIYSHPTSSPSSSSSRSKKSSNRRLFNSKGTGVLASSDEIKIPTRCSSNQLNPNGDRTASSKPHSTGGSSEGSSLESRLAKPPTQQLPVSSPPLYFPSVLVGAGIITSLIPGPPPSSRLEPPTDRGGAAVSQTWPKPTSDPSLRPPPPPPPPPLPPLPVSTHSVVVCDFCRHQRDQQNPPTVTEDFDSCGRGDSGGVFTADEDFEQVLGDPVLLSTADDSVPDRTVQPPSRNRSVGSLYELYKHICHTVSPSLTPEQNWRRCRTPDICAMRRRILTEERVFVALGAGDGSPLAQLLRRVTASVPPLPPPACVFLLAFPSSRSHASLKETDYEWYLVHRPGHCCSQCCLWNTSVCNDLNLQVVLSQQARLLDIKAATQPTPPTPDVIPLLVASGLVVWCLVSTSSFGCSPSSRSGNLHLCPNHNDSSGGAWSVLYFGAGSPTSAFVAQSSSTTLTTTTTTRCCICGSLVPPLVTPVRSLAPHRSDQHNYANLRRSSSGGRGDGFHCRPPQRYLDTNQQNPTLSPDCADGVGGPARGGFAHTTSNSYCTSLASSPNSPQGLQSYYNLQRGASVASPSPPKPRKPSFLEDRGATTLYANLSHLLPTTNRPCLPQRHGWLLPSSGGTARSSAAAAENHIPDEIREPKRNYALVDLRPSPASSVIAPADAKAIVSPVMDLGSKPCTGNSSASTIHTNMSSSSSSTIVPQTAESHRRRTSSHSLTSVLPVPTLNYVHIMTSTSIGKSRNPMWDCGTSPSAASSSTASSSEKEQHPPVAESVTGQATGEPYAQIDFARTRALNAVNFTDAHAAATAATTTASATSASMQKPGSRRLMAGACVLRSLHTRKKSDCS